MFFCARHDAVKTNSFVCKLHDCYYFECRGSYLVAQGKYWHPEEFVCATPGCGRSLQGTGFIEEKGKRYCSDCHEKNFARMCGKCHQKIVGVRIFLKYACSSLIKFLTGLIISGFLIFKISNLVSAAGRPAFFSLLIFFRNLLIKGSALNKILKYFWMFCFINRKQSW